MTGLLWAKPQQEKPSWALIRTGKKGLASHSGNSCVWDTVSCMTSLVLIASSADFGIVAHEECLHRALLWAEKLESPASSAPLDAQPAMPKSDVSPIIQPPATVPSPLISDTSPIIQPQMQGPTVPSLPMQPTATVPSPPISDTSQPPAQAPTVLSPSMQPTAQVPTVPSPPISDIMQPPAQAPTVPSSTPHMYFLMNSGLNQAGFTPDLSQTFSPTLYSPYANPQQSWLDYMSEPLYSWPNQDQHGIGNQTLFDFSGVQGFPGMNNFNSTGSFHSPDINVGLVLQSLQIFVHIHSLPLSHSRTATTATLPQISTCCPQQLL